MRKVILLLAGVATAAGLVLVSRSKRLAEVPVGRVPVDDLAHRLQDAWADHHTVAEVPEVQAGGGAR